MYICTRQMSLSAHANALTSVGTVLVPLSLMSWLAVVCRVSLCYNLLETWVRLLSQKTVRICCMRRERRRDTRGAWGEGKKEGEGGHGSMYHGCAPPPEFVALFNWLASAAQSQACPQGEIPEKH